MPDPSRIPLRHYRLFSRAPYIEVGAGEIALRLPGAFGGKRRWRIPIAEVAVVEPGHQRVVADNRRDGSVFVEPLRIPYLATTSNDVSATLELLFRHPVRVPPVRFAGAFNNRALKFFASRSAEGWTLDGVRLRAKDPRVAFTVLVAAGAEPALAPGLWLADHREMSNDPAVVEGVVRRERRAKWEFGITVTAVPACVVVARVMAQDHHADAAFIPLGAALAVGYAPIALRRRRTSERHKHEPPPSSTG